MHKWKSLVCIVHSLFPQNSRLQSSVESIKFDPPIHLAGDNNWYHYVRLSFIFSWNPLQWNLAHDAMVCLWVTLYDLLYNFNIVCRIILIRSETKYYCVASKFLKKEKKYGKLGLRCLFVCYFPNACGAVLRCTCFTQIHVTVSFTLSWTPTSTRIYSQMRLGSVLLWQKSGNNV